MEEAKIKDIGLVLEPREKPKSYAQWFIFAIQHVFAMFGSTVLVPIIINSLAKETVMTSSMALFCSGVGTLIYIVLTKAKVPMYLGSSFAYMSAIGLNYPAYGNSVFVAVMVAGLIYILFGILVYYLGTEFIEKIFPVIVIGPLIMIIGLSAAPSALTNAGIVSADAWAATKKTYPQWLAAIIAIFTFMVTVIVTLKAKGIAKVVPVIIGIAAGFILSLIIHFSMKDSNLMDISKITDVKQWEWYPSFKRLWKQEAKNIFPSILAISPLAIIAMAEHIGDHIAMGYITKKDFVKDPGIHRTLIADGVSIVFDGLVGGPPNTTYGENTAIVGMTKVASVWVIGTAAVIAILLSFIAPVNQTIAMLPDPAMGGVGMIMFGFISINGVRIMITNKTDFMNMRNVFISATVLVIGLVLSVLGQGIDIGWFNLPGLGLAAFTGIILNLILPHDLNQGFVKIEWIKSKLKRRK
ncbi:uracil-xanthine permease family protein [Mesoplasma melaleucae]|uniref:Uracil permease n=1 Tax=Mesoplasma melaleucae TaxID=81459 RepID=A0A2K8NYS6_9MOLU|nr:uracil-xanthine permease family protein [Mesoplasma melaleucae]ATZ18358.1 uracil permease [Mesoplasma melaleucae]